MRFLPAGLAAILALVALIQDPPGTQDPVRPIRPPVGAGPLPPVPDPPTSPVERRDLVRAFLPPTGYEGFYRLTGVAVGGRVAREGFHGYLAIGREHLSVYVARAAPADAPPMVQAGFRRYRIEDGTLVTTALVGHDNLTDGQLRFEPIGLVERRKLERTPTSLRVVQAEGTWMEFERVE